MPVAPLDSSYGETMRYVPPWGLQCLRAYLLSKTRHSCAFIDCRLFSDLEANLVETLGRVPGPRVLVVNTSCLGLGQAVGVIEIVKARYPDSFVFACGEFPSQFPDKAAGIPHIDYAMAGDPEPILRAALDAFGVPSRLARIPGLLHAGSVERPSASWLPDLLGLSLPDWQGIFWPAYEASPSTSGGRAKIRLSRGHTGTPQDRAFPDVNQPLRVWPLAKVAACLQRCAHLGIVEVFVSDPPGFWTVDRLTAWCHALRDERNRQPWAFQTLPLDLPPETFELLYSAGCRRVEILLPSADPDVLKRYGCAMDTAAITDLMERLRRSGISAKAFFWLGSPEEKPGETGRVSAMIRAMGYCPFALKAFPFHFDAPFYGEQPKYPVKPAIEVWLNWARHPWTEERPLPIWGGQSARTQISQTIDQIERSIGNSPALRIRRMINAIRSRNWIIEMENAALSFLAQKTPRPK
jgi:hypothetical protein